MDSNSALTAWSQRGLNELHLPSGTVVKVHLTDPATLIRMGLIPSDLVAIAMQSGSISDATPEQMIQFARLAREVAARSIRQVSAGDGEWQLVSLTVDLLDELDLPADDIAVLEAVAMRRISAAEFNGQPREADATVDGWTEFRGEREGAEPGAGGPDVRSEPGEDVPGPQRPVSRRADRRGARAEVAG